MFFDTHAHYDDVQFDTDRDELLAAVRAAGVSIVVDPGSDLESSKKAADIAQTHDFIYFAAGIHPEQAGELDDASLAAIAELCRRPKAVAVGEIGLDYHYENYPREVQRAAFRRQLELARELRMPVIVHSRDAMADTLNIVEDFPDLTGVFHCFSGSWESAREILDLGWYLSFTGVITFKNARRSLEVIAKMPRERLMLETDSPYMAPVPVRGQRNSSVNLRYIAAAAADVLGLSVEETARLTAENGRKFFALDDN